ncbi:MAG: transposase, partial [Deltaproteobacteria bacterium]
ERRGLVRGREEGREEGRTEGAAAMLLALLEQRGLTVSEAQGRRILACPSMLTLQRWMGRALVVQSVSELLAPAITRARRG